MKGRVCFLYFQQGMGRVSASFVCLLCSMNCWVEKENTAPLGSNNDIHETLYNRRRDNYIPQRQRTWGAGWA